AALRPRPSAYPQSQSLLKVERDLRLVNPRAVLGRQLEDDETPVLWFVDLVGDSERKRPARPAAGRRGDEVLPQHHARGVLQLVVERRLEGVRGSPDREAGLDRLARPWRLDEHRGRLRLERPAPPRPTRSEVDALYRREPRQ